MTEGLQTQGAASAPFVPAQTDVPFAIEKPFAGTVTIAETAQAKQLAFKFPYGSIKTAVLDIDLVILFDDGAKIIIPGLALRMLSGDAPLLAFSDSNIDPQKVMAQVGDIQLADQLPQLIISSALKQEKPEIQAPSNGIPVVQMPSLPPASLTPSPSRRGSFETDTDIGSISASSGRFAKRTNSEEQSSSGGTGGETQSNDPGVTPPPEVDPTDNVNPTITSNGGGATASLNLLENGRNVANVDGTDPENSTLYFAIAGGLDAAKFAINSATGELYFIQPPNFETPTSVGGSNTYAVTVAVIDEFGGSDEQALTVSVTNVNEAPVSASISNAAISEAATAGMIVGTITAQDPDAGNILNYSFAPFGDANGRFVINGVTGVLSVATNAVLDAETSATETIVVRVTDQGGITYDHVFTINITDVSEPPIIISDGGGPSVTITFVENSTRVTTVSARDPEAMSITYSLAGGADQAKFNINSATGELTFIAAPDFEIPTDAGGNNIYDVIVQASDGTLNDTQAIAVTVTNTNEAPVITSNGGVVTAAVTIVEGTTAITTVTATDPDANTSITYSFGGGADDSKFTINATTGVLTFISAPDFENPTDVGGNNIYIVVVRASDGSLIDTQAISITVTNTNDNAPVITSSGGLTTAAISMAENGTAVTTVFATDADAATTITYSLVGGADQLKFSINSATGVLTFIATQDFEAPTDVGGNNIYDVIVRASDGTLTDDQAIAVTVTNANEAPAITSNGGLATAAISIAENTAAVTTVIAGDPDAAATITYSIVGGADQLKFNIDAITGALTFASAPDFENPTDSGGNNTYNVIVRASDGTLNDDQAIAVTVTDGNDSAPVINSNGGLAIASINMAENGTAVTTVVATDADATTTITYSLVGGADQLKFNINSATGVLTFASAPNFDIPGDASGDNIYDVIVRASDGTLSDDQTIAVTVTNANEAPSITSNGGLAAAAISIGENTTAVTTVTVLDPDAGSTITYTLSGMDAALFAISATGVLTFNTAPDFEIPTDAGNDNVYNVIVQASDGSLTDTQAIAVTVTNANEAPIIASNGGLATASISMTENGTAVTTVVATDADAATIMTYSLVGGADQSKFAINATTGVLTFIATQDFETPTDVGGNNNYDVIVRASDGTLSDDQTIAVTVTNTNEAPVITSGGGGTLANVSMAENSTAATTVVAVDSDAGATQTYTIVGGADQLKFIINSATGVLTFVSAPNFETPADSNGDNIYGVDIQVSDGLGGTDVQTVFVTVTNVNEAPTITSNGGLATAAVSIAENVAAVTTVGAADPDASTTITYTFGGGADDSKFNINATTGVLTFITVPDFDAPTDVGGNNIYDVIVRASDGTFTDDQAIAVTVTNVNEAPVITSYGGLGQVNVSMVENNFVAATVVATDPDVGATLTYSLFGGPDRSFFDIDPTTGVLTFITAPNFEMPLDFEGNNTYGVDVYASDGLGGSVRQTVFVTVTNANEAPTITSNGGLATASVSIAENGSAVTTVTATDPDAASTITYSLAGGADAAKFTINAATGALIFTTAPDFDVPTDVGANNVYDVIVRAYDGSLNDDQAIAITVTNVNEAPVITSNGSLATAVVSVVENGVGVTTVTATDQDVGAALVYSIVGGADQARFIINSTTGVLTFVSAPDFENPTDAGGNNIYDVIVRATDGALSDDQAIAVTVTNANEAPVITSNGGLATASISVAENGSAVTTVTAIDPDAATTITYSLVGGADQAKFTIDPATGVLTFLTAPDFDLPTDVGANNVYDVIVRTSDGTLTDDQAIAVIVTNVNEAPFNATLSANSVVENAANGTVVGSITGLDPDAGSTFTYSMVVGQDAGGRFTISSGGQITVANGTLLDFETATTHAITVRVTDQGNLFFDRVFNINLTNQIGAFTGTIGADSHAGTTEEDVINGLAGNDTLSGNLGNDTINGMGDNDVLFGEAGNDTIDGGAGDDQLTGGAGADTLIGGAGEDYVRYDNDTVGVDINLDVSTAAGGVGSEAAGDVISGFEHIVGGSGNDTLIGSGLDNIIYGQDGNDSIDGGGGNDIIVGGPGTDTLVGGGGEDWLDYGNDSTGVVVNITTNTASGGYAQGDVISGFENLQGGAAADNLTGTTGANQMRGNYGSDVIAGLDGNDTIYGDLTIADVLDGTDSIDAGSGDDLVYGGGGDDTVTGGVGNDIVDGGTGNDTVILSGRRGDYNVTLSGSTYTITDGRAGFDGVDTVTNAENFQFSDGVIGVAQVADIVGTAGNDGALNGTGVANVIYGLAGNDAINGGGGNDWISAGDDNDTVTGGFGADSLFGGTGIDTLDYSAETANVNINVTTGTATGGSTGDTFSQFESVQTGSGNDTLSSGTTGTYLYGGVGNDTFIATSAGVSLYGQGGADTFTGAAGVEFVRYGDSTTSVTVNLLTGLGTGGDAQGDVYSNIEGIEGSLGNDVIIGNNLGNELTGSYGSDTITGGTVADYIYGGYAYGPGSADNNDVGDSLNGGDGNDTVYGAGGNDTIFGAAGNDALFGGRIALQDVDTGNDTLNGGAGNDTIDGGAGTDTAEFTGTLADYTISQVGAVYTVVDNRALSPDGTDTITNVELFQFTDGTVSVPVSIMSGGTGNDAVSGTTGNDLIYGLAGDDILSGGDGSDTIFGGAGQDALNGDAGNDRLILGSGRGYGRGGSGADTIDGSGETNPNLWRGAFYDTSATAVNINLATNALSGGDAMGDVLINIDYLEGSAFNDTLTGDADLNWLYGNAGNDSIDGADGNDYIYGGAGADTLIGGNGSDLIYYVSSTSGVSVDLGTNVVSGGDATGDVINGFELLVGSSFNDTLTGAVNTITISAGSGDDLVSGASGNDYFGGDQGSDTLLGGDGADTLYGEAYDSATNGSFEDGLTGWTRIGSVNATIGSTPTEGLQAVNFSGGDTPNDGVLSQTVDTVAGQLYSLGFEFGAWGVAVAQSLKVEIIDVTTSAVLMTTTLNTIGAVPAFMQHVDLSFTTTGNSTIMRFSDVSGVTAGVDLVLDNIRFHADYNTADSIDGGNSNDFILGGGGNDTLNGGADNDRISGATGDDSITGGMGNDHTDAGIGNDTLTGDAGNDTIVGALGTDLAVFSGNRADYTITLASGVYTVVDNRGGSPDGTDVVSGVENFQFADGVVAEASILTSTAPTAGNDVLTGTTGADAINALAGSDIISGLGGDDTLTGGAGGDTIDGGTGNDTAIYTGNRADYTITLFGPTYSIIDNRPGSPDGADTVDNIDFFQFTDGTIAAAAVADIVGSTGNDVALTGGNDANVILGLAGNDTLVGGNGNDRLNGGQNDDLLEGGTGADTLIGGGDVDMITYAGSSSGVSVNLGTGAASGGDASGDVITGGDFRGLTGSGFNDLLIGDASGNTLNGRAGNDTLEGGNGIDVIDGGGGFDTLQYTGSSAGVNLNLLSGAVSGGDATGDTIVDFEYVNGSLFNDTIAGDGAANYLFGNAGADSLDGGGDNDTLEGGVGADILVAGGGIDSLTYASSTSAVNIDVGVSTYVGGDAAGDNVSGFEIYIGSAFNDSMTGSSAAETIIGGAGNDTLHSWTGDDSLHGGEGNDMLTAGGGNDTILGDGGDDAIFIDFVALGNAATDIQGGSGNDSVTVSGSGTNTLAQLVGNLTQIETIDFSQTGIVGDFSNATAADIRSILGISSGTGTLTLDFDGTGPFNPGTGQFTGGNDTFTAAVGQFTSFNGGTNTTTFFTDATMTTELAKVMVV